MDLTSWHHLNLVARQLDRHSCQNLHVFSGFSYVLWRCIELPCIPVFLCVAAGVCWAYLQLIYSDLALVGWTGFKLALDKTSKQPSYSSGRIAVPNVWRPYVSLLRRWTRRCCEAHIACRM